MFCDILHIKPIIYAIVFFGLELNIVFLLSLVNSTSFWTGWLFWKMVFIQKFIGFHFEMKENRGISALEFFLKYFKEFYQIKIKRNC